MSYAEFAIRSNFSFLEGASHPEEYAMRAKELGLAAFALADRNTVAGVVRAHQAAKQAGITFHPGCRLVFTDTPFPVLGFPVDRRGWGNLCRLLTSGNLRGEKGAPDLHLEDLLEWGDGQELCALYQPGEDPQTSLALLKRLKERFGDHIRLAIARAHGPSDRHDLALATEIACRAEMPLMAMGDAFYHLPDRRPLQDVLTAIRLKVPVMRAGLHLAPHAERYLKAPDEMMRLFAGHEDALAETMRLTKKLSFSLDELRYEYPEESTGRSATPQAELERLSWLGARQRYGSGIPEKVRRQIVHELRIVTELDYAPYFLTVHDIVRFARSKDILCQGRGSAANSTICYCLGITSVDPAMTDLLFERFISPERREPPDIDVDFEHERREEVIQYIYAKYGRERAGLAATVITYRARSASREVARALGLSADVMSSLAGSIWGRSSSRLGERTAAAAGLDTADASTRHLLSLASEILRFPRHLSQHVGGFVITRDRLDEVVPITKSAMDGRTMVEWDKDDLDALGILKIDILALGMLSCLRRAFDLLRLHYDRPMSLASVPKQAEEVYDMVCRADTLGTFQVESRAQMSMLPRLRPRKFYDLVIQVAIVRPGPILGKMVHPYLRRRQGLEKVTYPKDELREVLERTLGVPLFQEQAMQIAIVAAGFTPAEADRLRRAMATFRRVGTIHTFRDKMVEGMAAKGYDREFATHCFQQIEGFGEYGFPESHAASFALLVYASCWLKCFYPDVFCAAMLNSQPLGFYAPAQLVRDAREHGVTVRAADINHSDWDATLELASFDPAGIHSRHRSMKKAILTRHAVRIGLRQIKGFSEADAAKLVAARDKAYVSVRDLWLRSGLGTHVILRLAEADAFRSLGLDRRRALWQAQALDAGSAAERLPLFEPDRNGPVEREPQVFLPAMTLGEHVVHDYRHLSLSLKAHPLSFLRDGLERERTVTCSALGETPDGRLVRVAGLVLVRQQPGTAKGVIFMTIEDETGAANIIVWPKVFEEFRPLVMGARLVRISGRLQSQGGVIHVIARRVEDLSCRLAILDGLSGAAGTRKVMPKGRNFQ